LVKSPQIQQQKEEEGQHHSVANEELNEELILHCWRLVQEQVRRVIEFNRSQGVPNPDVYVGYNYADGTTEPMSVKQKIRWLNITRHRKGGRPTTVIVLLQVGAFPISKEKCLDNKNILVLNFLR
jgi:hypothetical protein